MKIKTILNHLINIILSTFFSFSIMLALISSLNFSFSAVNALAWCCVLNLSLFFILLNKKTLLYSLCFFLISIIVMWGYLIYKGVSGLMMDHFAGFFMWIFDYLAQIQPAILRYELYLSIILCLVISLWSIIFTAKNFKFILILVPGILIFVSQWMLEYFVSFTSFYIFCFIILIYFVLHVYKRNSKYLKDNQFASQFSFTLLVLPICFLVFITAYFTPARSNPLEWTWLDDKIANAVQSLKNENTYGDNGLFSLNDAGFGSGDLVLGGRTRLNKTHVLTVESPKRIYLRGNCQDYYTGYSWIPGQDSVLINGSNINTLLELHRGIRYLTSNTMTASNSFSFINIKVTYENITTRSIFNTLNMITYQIPFEDNTLFIRDDNDNRLSVKILSKGFNYTFNTNIVTKHDKNFEDLLRASKKGLYKDFANLTRNSFQYFEAERLASAADSIYKKYTQIPDSLPSRVRDLASDITKNDSTTYDKVKSIEQYLAKNYSYTLNPKKSVSKKRDFVDFFLFDSKEGYCTYYATAMTVLVRSLGIPSRYVEGYILPSSPISGNIYHVTNEQAHAWVEVYFEGIGWIAFEPTSPFVSQFYDDSFEANYSPDFERDPAYYEYIEELKGKSNTDTPDSVASDENTDIKASIEFNPTLVISILFALVLALLILINALKNLIKYILMKRMNPRNSILSFYRYFLNILSVHDLKFEPGETPAVFSDRVDRLMGTYPVSFNAITQIFSIARYSDSEISKQQKDDMLNYNSILLEKTKEYNGAIRYFVYRYILGKF